jgi:hypothetical protein
MLHFVLSTRLGAEEVEALQSLRWVGWHVSSRYLNSLSPTSYSIPKDWPHSILTVSNKTSNSHCNTATRRQEEGEAHVS